MNTSNTTKHLDLLEITTKDDVVYILVNNEYTAKEYLKRNSRASVTKGNGDQYLLAYGIDNCNLTNIIKRG